MEAPDPTTEALQLTTEAPDASTEALARNSKEMPAHSMMLDRAVA